MFIYINPEKIILFANKFIFNPFLYIELNQDFHTQKI